MTREPTMYIRSGGASRIARAMGIGLFACLALALSVTAEAQSLTNSEGKISLGLTQFLNLVLERNESVQLRVLELEITKKRHNAEKGVFEPEFVASMSHEENERENTAEQRRSLRLNVFRENNNIYSSGIEALVPSGAKVKLAYTMRDLNNNLQDPRTAGGSITTNAGKVNEFQTFAGLTVTQPLLRNFGFTATLANSRLAAIASDISYQEYRRQLMETVATAEAAYWNLFMAQEQVKFFRDSVGVAESIMRDNRVKAEAGRGSDLEVLEAEAGLALRQTKLADAVQRRQEAEMRLLTMYSDAAFSAHPPVEAGDRPVVLPDVPDFLPSAEAAFELNPDYQAQQNKIKQEDIRLAYAKNQRLPQLDLHGSYGLNGLGDTPSASHSDLERQSFPTFSIGVELRVPLAGGIKSRNELGAAKLRKQQALLSLKQVETQVINAIQAAVQKIRSARDAVESNQKVVNFHQNLLTNELERLNVGKVESRRVLEVEAALFESRNAVLDAMVQYERARLELELVQGSILKARRLDYSQPEIQDRTAMLLYQGRRSEPEFQNLMQALYATPPAEPPPTTPAQEVVKARQMLRESLERYRRSSPQSTSPPVQSPASSPNAPASATRPSVPPASSLSEDELSKARRMLDEALERGQSSPRPSAPPPAETQPQKVAPQGNQLPKSE